MYASPPRDRLTSPHAVRQRSDGDRPWLHCPKAMPHGPVLPSRKAPKCLPSTWTADKEEVTLLVSIPPEEEGPRGITLSLAPRMVLGSPTQVRLFWSVHLPSDAPLHTIERIIGARAEPVNCWEWGYFRPEGVLCYNIKAKPMGGTAQSLRALRCLEDVHARLEETQSAPRHIQTQFVSRYLKRPSATCFPYGVYMVRMWLFPPSKSDSFPFSYAEARSFYCAHFVPTHWLSLCSAQCISNSPEGNAHSSAYRYNSNGIYAYGLAPAGDGAGPFPKP